MNLLSSLLLAAPALLAEGPDHVTLQDGKVLAGRVVHESPDEVVLRVNRKDRTIPRAEIQSILSLERSLAQLLERDFQADSAAVFGAMAIDSANAGLQAEARNLWLRVLLLEPDNEAARKALDVRGSKEDPTVHLGKEHLKLSSLRETQPKWSNAYTLGTTHFELKTDVALQRALDIGIGLERFHKTFYDLLQAPLRLYIFDEKELPEIRVYGTAAAYPAPPVAGQRVWFSEGENCLHAAADQPVRLPEVVSVLARQMLFSALRRSEGPTANMPAWVASGIEVYFGWTVPQTPGGAWPSPATPVQELFRTAAGTETTFERLFRGARNDFTDGQEAAELSACAYTLVHFLAHGRDGALRPGFGTFLREGAKGKLSMKALTDAVDMKADEIEQAWRDHVRTLAR
ncbi:MAG: hypothetical protein JNK02_06670 [Planctomycetes bacterium]|nr:hypothetical protein [Planctomycetota bacterium]